MGIVWHELWMMLAIYTVRGILGFVNYWIVFEKLFCFPHREWKKSNWIWILLYACVMMLYRPVWTFGERSYFQLLLLILYVVRIVPYLWSRYGVKPVFLAIALFYGSIVELISSNIDNLILVRFNINLYIQSDADVAVAITEMTIFVVLLLLTLGNRTNLIRIYFTRLTIAEYLILFFLNYSFGAMEVAVFELPIDNFVSALRRFSVLAFVLLLMLIIHIIIVRDQNTTMNTMIGNLKEPMDQITASYIEMEEKNTELRKFRHDTRNLLIALQSLIAEKKYDQASEYIDKMQEDIEATKAKAFDTGNFIADALLESKLKVAKRSDIAMTFEGRIPAGKVEDVSLVILISNLLDNAIESAALCEGERFIRIESILKKNIWIFTVKNPCRDNVAIRENHIESTKEDREAHGYGLSNIERVAKKYDGRLELSCEDKVFTARATLMLTE